jgi:cell division GTPase FtsZ
MIITDIKQIDCIAEETFGKTKGIVSIDMKDYAFIKEHSESLKVIKFEVPALTEDVVRSLDDAIIEAGKENVSNVLLYIKGNGSDAGIRAVTIEQFNMFIEVLNKHLETANIIWGMGDDEENRENISILIILGYGKRE